MMSGASTTLRSGSRTLLMLLAGGGQGAQAAGVRPAHRDGQHPDPAGGGAGPGPADGAARGSARRHCWTGASRQRARRVQQLQHLLLTYALMILIVCRAT